MTAYYVHMKTMLGGQQLADRFEVLTPLQPNGSLKHPATQVYPPALDHPVGNLLSGQPYSFWVTAATLAGEGPPSPIVTESPLRCQNFNNLQDMFSKCFQHTFIYCQIEYTFQLEPFISLVRVIHVGAFSQNTRQHLRSWGPNRFFLLKKIS